MTKTVSFWNLKIDNYFLVDEMQFLKNKFSLECCCTGLNYCGTIILQTYRQTSVFLMLCILKSLYNCYCKINCCSSSLVSKKKLGCLSRGGSCRRPHHRQKSFCHRPHHRQKSFCRRPHHRQEGFCHTSGKKVFAAPQTRRFLPHLRQEGFCRTSGEMVL